MCSIAVILTPQPVVEIQTIADLVTKGGALGLIISAVVTYRWGWWATGRELQLERERAARAEADAAKWESLALDLLKVASRATVIADKTTTQSAGSSPQ